MKYLKPFNENFAKQPNREKVIIGGYPVWVDLERSIIFDSEYATYGNPIDIFYFDSEYPKVSTGSKLTQEEKNDLINYIKSKTKLGYNYQVVNSLDPLDIPLDSSRRESFTGFPTKEEAYMKGLSAKIENRLSDIYVIKTEPKRYYI